MLNNNTIIFKNGTILTMTEEKTVEAIVVVGEKIEFKGSLEQCREFSNGKIEEIDLEGQCLMPGFVDPHVHVMMLGMCHTWADLSYPNVKSIDDIVKQLKKFSEQLPEDIPIRGFGFDQRKLKEKRYPTAKELDQVSKIRPVQIMNSSGHCNVVNNYLLEHARITSETRDPIGGSFGRDESGIPNGPLFDSANDYLAGNEGVRPGEHGPNIHMPDSADHLQRNIEVGQNLLISAGFTSVNDVQVTRQEMQSYLEARDSGLLKLRIELSYLSNYLETIKEMGFSARFGNDALTMGSLKLYADGSLISGTAYLNKAYSDTNKEGYLFHEPEEFKQLLIEAHEYGLQTLTHAQGDGAIELVIQGVEEAQRNNFREDMRHRVEHCGLPTNDQVKRMAELNIYPVPQPQHVYLFGNSVLKSIGEDGENFSPYGWFKQYGLPIVLSSDTPVAFPNAFEAIYAAVTRNTAQGNVIGEEHKITLEEALKGYTIEAAKAMHKEHSIGSIEVGKLADFAVLNIDPYAVKDKDLKDIKVTETWIGGEKVSSLSRVAT